MRSRAASADIESSKKSTKSRTHRDRGFINRKEEVLLQKVEKDDFALPEKLCVAKYDGEELARHWNAQNKQYLDSKPNVFKRAWKAWRQGIWGNTVLVVLFYLLAYYLINILFIQIFCAREYASQHTLVLTGQQLLIDAMSENACPTNHTDTAPQGQKTFDEQTQEFKNRSAQLDFKHSWCLGYDGKIMALAKKEATFTRLLTFLIGFYVSFTISRWWTQVTSVPTIDGVCLALEGYLWCDDRKKEDEIFVKEGVTVTQFKQTIVRYCLLSWTMCLSLVSPPLLEKFRDKLDYNNQHLLTFEEYEKLKTKNDDSRDSWKVKWTVPLIWVNAMLNEAETLNPAKPGNDAKPPSNGMLRIKELKEILKTTTEFQRRLHQVFEFNDNQIPDLIIQAIKLGVWFWLFVGIVSSQGLINKEANVGIPFALIMNFPLLHIIKYVVMFGWLHAASYLQNPFGKDE